MRSLAAAAKLLEQCTSVAAAQLLLRELGFEGSPVPLTDEYRALLGIPEAVGDASISSGKGALRALSFRICGDGDARDVIARIATRLSTRAPQLFFLLVAVQPQRNTATIAVYNSARPRPRVAALVADLNALVDSDSETVCALAAARGSSDILTYTRWLGILGRESITGRFFRALEKVVVGLARSVDTQLDASDAAELALLYTSRLVFLSFIETKGWLNYDHAFLANHFADCMVEGGDFHRRILAPLFFGTLNTAPTRRAEAARRFGRVPFLNGGLFSRTPLERRASRARFSDEAFGDVFGDLLTRYRFTAREDGTSWSEAAVDPEMLGKAFESLMSRDERKGSGAYYTPHSLVRQVSRSALTCGLSSDALGPHLIEAALDGSVIESSSRAHLLEGTARLRVLDPACGSGAFLVHMLEELCALRTRLGDLRRPHLVRRDLLTRSIFGVDVNPMAVWLCELRLWLAVAIEDPEPDPVRVTPLPNLDRNVRVGDSLSGGGLIDRPVYRTASRVTALRTRYSRATGPRKKSLGRAIDSLERECAVTLTERLIARLIAERRELLITLRSPDLFGKRRYPSAELRTSLSSLRAELASARRELRRIQDGGGLPFSFSTGFADAAAAGGFGIVVGNPPWVRTHKLDPARRKELRNRYVVYRNAAWATGADGARAGKGFASQVDLAALFIERCASLLQPGGALALIVPAKLWRSLAGGGVRHLLRTTVNLRELHDLTSAPDAFEAAVYPSVVAACRPRVNDASQNVKVVSHHRDGVRRWTTTPDLIAFDSSAGSPWLLMPPEVRAAFDRVSRRGIPLGRTSLGPPLLGVKTGCNDAFIVTDCEGIEPSLLRPVIRGDSVTRWNVVDVNQRIIWTHDDCGPLSVLPPRAAKHLTKWRRELEARTDSHRSGRWWKLFRTESADSRHARVVWSDIGKKPTAALLSLGDISVPLNTCYVIKCANDADAETFTTILNSPLSAAWLGALAEPARGGYSRFMGWTLALLPLPSNWARARSLLAPIARAGVTGSPAGDAEILASVLEAYQLRFDDVAALVEWSG